jgi:Asp-tRNA(Asn)/Glu-tRNA(Gln) amidotransferase C subunit
MSSKNIESDLLFQMVKEKYGTHLSEEQLEEVKSGLDTIIDMAEAIRAVDLDYTDEPSIRFKPYKGE